MYKFTGAETGLIPDVGFFRAERRASIVNRAKPIPGVPDLAMAAKARTYLDGGTSLVWVVWPGRKEVDVWRAGRSVGPAGVLTVSDTLDGEDVVPGFQYAVAAVFADPLG